MQINRDESGNITNTENNVIINLSPINNNNLIQFYPGFDSTDKVKLKGILEIRSTIPNLWFKVESIQLKLKTDQELLIFDNNNNKLLKKLNHSTSPFNSNNVITRFKNNEIDNEFVDLYKPVSTNDKLTGCDIPFSYTLYDSLGLLPSLSWEWYDNKKTYKYIYSIRNYLIVKLSYFMAKTLEYNKRMTMMNEEEPMNNNNQLFLERFTCLKLFEIPIVFHNLINSSPFIYDLVNYNTEFKDTDLLITCDFLDDKRIISFNDSIQLSINLTFLTTNSKFKFLKEINCSLRQIITTDDGKSPVITTLDEVNQPLNIDINTIINTFNTLITLSIMKDKGKKQTPNSINSKIIELQNHQFGTYLSVPLGPGREICTFNKSVGINKVLVNVKHELIIDIVLSTTTTTTTTTNKLFTNSMNNQTIKKRYTIPVVKSNLGKEYTMTPLPTKNNEDKPVNRQDMMIKLYKLNSLNAKMIN